MNSPTNDNLIDAARSMAAGGHGSADDPLAQAIDEYLRAVESGATIDREAFFARFPEIGHELRECLEALEFVDGVAIQIKTKERESRDRDQLQPLSAIGDYRIIREIGRGGMGIVYEAEQLSIGRKVALKVLPFAAVLDPKSLIRFKHEAQAAGSLKHPNIVGVHSVGCERGVHYYAMELVDGKSLAEVIAGQREPAATSSEPRPAADTAPLAALSTKASSGTPSYFRAVASLGVQAAEALEHAHQRGIIHRDVKPSNLMVDGTGNLWITDFGLAQIESDATRLTMTGELLGTLRYMSPEQAVGDRRRLDHRTDVYSLGMTLYELLTGRPAFGGGDRGKLLRDIVECEPPSPRKINAAIPRDLETVVLKATSKEPAARYTTAGELAADLQRYLDHRSILARRPSLANRVLRWCRRNRLVAALSACLMLTFSSSLFVLAQRGRVTSPAARPSTSGIGLRLVHTGGDEIAGNISPDGKRLAYPNWDTANIAMFDLETGGRRDMTTAGTWDRPGQYGEEAVWSHDGKLLAYNWYKFGGKQFKAAAQLRIMAADGTGERVVFEPKKRQIVWPVSWSGDGRQVLVQLSDRKDRETIVLVDVADGSARQLQSFEPPLSGRQQLSPSGRFVVYSRSQTVAEAPRDLYLLDTQSREVSLLIDHPANDHDAFWTPDGRWIVFLSDRGGNTGLWAIRFRDGRPFGEPRPVHARLDDIAPKGFDKQGSYYYAAWPSLINIYTAEVDFNNNAVVAPPRKLESKHEGRNPSADWSPDGTQLAYLSRLGPQRLQPRVTIRNLQTSGETEWQPGSPLRRLSRFSGLQWTADGNTLLMPATDEREQAAWFEINAASGRVSESLKAGGSAGFDSWSLSNDGRFLYIMRRRRITRVDVEKGTDRTVYQVDPRENDLRGLAVSPDGRQLAVVTLEQQLRVVSSDGKTARTLYRAGPGAPGLPASWAIAWTPDGTRLVFGLHADGNSKNVVLWQIPVTGGEPQALGITMPALRSLRIHPDGRRILFIARSPGSGAELWAIDNVLAYLNALE